MFFIVVAPGPARDLLLRELSARPGVAIDGRGRIPLALAMGEEVLGLPYGETSSLGIRAFTHADVAPLLADLYRRALGPVLEKSLEALHGSPFVHGGFLTDDAFLISRIPLVWPQARVLVVTGPGVSATDATPDARFLPAERLLANPEAGMAEVLSALGIDPASYRSA
jgi:hypothetical protein